MTKTSNDHRLLNDTFFEFELEVEYGQKKKIDKQISIDKLFDEIIILHKIIQEANFIITNSKKDEVIKHYRELTNSSESSAFLNGRQPISFELQYISDVVPNKYAVTDKADGERYFMVIYKKHCYLISTNLNVKDTGIELKSGEYDNTI